MRRVVVSGIGFISSLGDNWESIKTSLLSLENQVKRIDSFDEFEGLNTKLGAPLKDFTLPEHYNRKKIRGMGKVSLYSVRASELALIDANLLDSEEIKMGRCGVAYGSSTGSTDAIADVALSIVNKNSENVNATTYVRMMPHTTAVNIALFFGITGRIIPSSTACTSGSLSVGYAYESIKHGYQDIMLAGGGEEFCPSEALVFDVLYATSQLNDEPKLTPKPFDLNRDGLVIGEGACTLVLEEYEHAKARGAKILAEVVGFASNCDATHITQPNSTTMQICMQSALDNAHLQAQDIGYISAHGTATDRGDIAEGMASYNIFGNKTPISSLKSYVGHTLGACGSLEASIAIKLMHEKWFNPTLNLTSPDPACGELDHIMHDIRKLEVEHIMSNNFAFGGVNTSLIFKAI